MQNPIDPNTFQHKIRNHLEHPKVDDCIWQSVFFATPIHEKLILPSALETHRGLTPKAFFQTVKSYL